MKTSQRTAAHRSPQRLGGLSHGVAGKANGPRLRREGPASPNPRRVTTSRTGQRAPAWWARCRVLGLLGLAVVVLAGGCASPFGRPIPGPPQVEGIPRQAPPAPPSVPSPATPPPRAVPPRQGKASPALVASAQWVEEGISAIEAGDYHRATAVLERAISVEPNNGRAFYYYGMAMGETGNPGNAVTLLRKAEILLRGDGPAMGDVYTQMGVNLERLGRQQEAVQRYQQALEHNPAQAVARRRLAALRG